jgi:2'-5' RNA ligase
VRLFVAIPLPPDVAARASAILPTALPALRRVKPENLHLTLAFLGETPEGRLPDVGTAAEEAAKTVPPFTLSFDGVGQFPERGRPRVVWLGVGAGASSLQRLGESLHHHLRSAGLDFEDRPLAAHLTLARVEEDATGPETRTITAALRSLDIPRLELEVGEIVVVQSTLTPQGARYARRAGVQLG